jgi:GNAT superfamily N-acetyltransferase
VDLLDDLSSFYGEEIAPGSRNDRIDGVEAALFGQPPSALALLAWGDSSAVGLASYSFLWPASGVTRSLYLKELYVIEGYRRTGVGAALMGEIFKAAQAKSCSRVEWATEVGNTDAQKFYESLGATQLNGKVSYRVSVET